MTTYSADLARIASLDHALDIAEQDEFTAYIAELEAAMEQDERDLAAHDAYAEEDTYPTDVQDEDADDLAAAWAEWTERNYVDPAERVWE